MQGWRPDAQQPRRVPGLGARPGRAAGFRGVAVDATGVGSFSHSIFFALEIPGSRFRDKNNSKLCSRPLGTF